MAGSNSTSASTSAEVEGEVDFDLALAKATSTSTQPGGAKFGCCGPRGIFFDLPPKKPPQTVFEGGGPHPPRGGKKDPPQALFEGGGYVLGRTHVAAPSGSRQTALGYPF